MSPPVNVTKGYLTPTQSAFDAVLYQLDFVVSVAVCLVILWVLYRAYKRTKFTGIAIWGFGTLISLCNVITMHTIGRDRRNIDLAILTLFSFRTLWIVDSVLIVVGAVLVIREFVRLSDINRRV